jgi:hypothetical protein
VYFDNLGAINLYGGDDASYDIRGTSGSATGTTIISAAGTNRFAVRAITAPLTIDSTLAAR